MDAANWRWARTSRSFRWVSESYKLSGGVSCRHTCISADGTGEVSVNRARQPVVTKRVPSDAPRAEVLSRQHTSCCHDPHKSIEGR